MSSTVTKTLSHMETLHSFVSYHGLADQKIRTMRSNWNIPNSRLSRSASFSDVNSVTATGNINGYHSNGFYPKSPFHNGTILEENQILSETDKTSSEKPRRSSYAGCYSEPTKSRRRPSYKRLRSRKHAIQRINSDSSPYASPCELLEQVIDYHSEDANDSSTSVVQRVVPIVMTWYMTFTEELYNAFRGQSSTRHRFWMWTLACITTTFMTLALLGFFAFALLHTIDLVVVVAVALVKFVVLVIAAGFISCCAVLILNYTGND